MFPDISKSNIFETSKTNSAGTYMLKVNNKNTLF